MSPRSLGKKDLFLRTLWGFPPQRGRRLTRNFCPRPGGLLNPVTDGRLAGYSEIGPRCTSPDHLSSVCCVSLLVATQIRENGKLSKNRWQYLRYGLLHLFVLFIIYSENFYRPRPMFVGGVVPYPPPVWPRTSPSIVSPAAPLTTVLYVKSDPDLASGPLLSSLSALTLSEVERPSCQCL